MEKKEIVIGVYKITNTNSDKYYIGYSKNIDRRFTTHKCKLKHNSHHNIFMQRAYNLDGIDKFTYEIIHICETIKEAREKELFYLEDLSIRINLYNLHYNNSGGDLLSMHPDKERICKQISATSKKNLSEMTQEERNNKFGHNGSKNGMFGKTHTEEARKKISKINKGRPSPNKGGHISDEQKKILSESAKLRVGEKNAFFGKHHSEETKAILRAKRTGNIPTNSISITIDDINYISITDASRQLGLCTTTVLWRLKSKNPKFNNYKYTENIDNILV